MKIKIIKVISERKWNKDSKTPRDYSKEHNPSGSKEQEERNKRKRDKRKHDKEHGECPEGEELHHVNGIEDDDLQCEPVSKNRGRKEKSRLKKGEIVIKIKKSSCGELNEIEQSAPSDQQVRLVQDLLKNILVVGFAAKDAGALDKASLEEGIGSTIWTAFLDVFRTGENTRKGKRQRAKEVKKMSGLTGIKFSDFTPEQKNLYRVKKAEFLESREAGDFKKAATLIHGDLYKLPFVRNIMQGSQGLVLKTALTAVLGNACASSLNLECLVIGLVEKYQGG